MSMSTSEHIDVEVVINSKAFSGAHGRERRYSIEVRTKSGYHKGPTIVHSAEGLTLGEVDEILAAIHHSRDRNDILIPYVNMHVPSID